MIKKLKCIRNLFCKHQFERIYAEDNNVLVYKCKNCGKVVKSELFGREVGLRNGI